MFFPKMKANYTPPSTQIIEIKQFASILATSPGGVGNIPLTPNNNDDFDWVINNCEIYENKFI